MMKRVILVAVVLCAFVFAAGNTNYKLVTTGEKNNNQNINLSQNNKDATKDGRSITQKINYQGYLTNSSGSPITNPSLSITFKIYNDEFVGSVQWTATKSVVVENGVFSVLLDVSSDIFTPGAPRWLELTIGGVALTPRTELTAVGFSYKTIDADKINGQTIGDLDGRYVNEGQDDAISTDMIVNSNVTMPKIAQADATNGQVIKWNGSAWVPSADVGGNGEFLPLAGGTMSGAITNTGDPSITMGKGNFGSGNSNAGDYAFVAGQYDTASGVYSTIGGGLLNHASYNYATVGGGGQNIASGGGSTVGGGSGNHARGNFAVVAGGGGEGASDSNSANGDNSTIGGGGRNIANGYCATVGGGDNNIANGYWSTVGGGDHNNAIMYSTTVSGGSNNAAGYYGSTVSGGVNDSAISPYATVGGGYSNKVNGSWSTISGGDSNTAGTSDFTTVGGGQQNSATGWRSTVGGGQGNLASGRSSTVSGGEANTAGTSDFSTVGGGTQNSATGWRSTVGGGQGNLANNRAATVSGGEVNTASGQYSTVPGGTNNTAGQDFSFAAGRRAKADHYGTFVWADGTDADFTSTAMNQFNIRASGGTRIFSNSGLTAGVTLAPGGGSWSSVSDRAMKRNIRLVNTKEILNKVAQLPINRWSYKSQDPSIEHIGPVAQDFYAIFKVGDDDKTISTIDPSGIALAAIQELAKQNQELYAQNKDLSQKYQDLQTKIDYLLKEIETLKSQSKTVNK
jgi:hypothetical protein